MTTVVSFFKWEIKIALKESNWTVGCILTKKSLAVVIRIQKNNYENFQKVAGGS